MYKIKYKTKYMVLTLFKFKISLYLFRDEISSISECLFAPGNGCLFLLRKTNFVYVSLKNSSDFEKTVPEFYSSCSNPLIVFSLVFSHMSSEWLRCFRFTKTSNCIMRKFLEVWILLKTNSHWYMIRKNLIILFSNLWRKKYELTRK